ncbi:MAG: hypothetical protein ACOCW2_03830, partial [Chitinivibrionales bacterium]
MYKRILCFLTLLFPFQVLLAQQTAITDTVSTGATADTALPSEGQSRYDTLTVGVGSPPDT